MQYNKSSKQTEIFLQFGLTIGRLGIRSRFAYLFQKEIVLNGLFWNNQNHQIYQHNPIVLQRIELVNEKTKVKTVNESIAEYNLFTVEEES